MLPWFWLALILAATIWLINQPSLGGRWQRASQTFTICGQGRSEACVIDGDTIVIGYPPKARKIRISDYNAPELDGQCAAESALALTSRAELLGWLNRGPFEMSGGDSPPYDKFGRELRELKRTLPNGDDDWLLDTMLAHHGGRSKWGMAFNRKDDGWCR